MLREALSLAARRAGRWAGHHRLCAEVLRRTHGHYSVERLAGHLLIAGDHTSALPALRAAIIQRSDEGDYRREAALVARYRTCVETVELAEEDPRVLWLRLREIMGSKGEGNFARARDLASRLQADAETLGERLMIADARQQAGLALEALSSLPEAADALEEAVAIARSAGDRERLARYGRSLGEVYRKSGLLAMSTLVQGLRRYEPTLADALHDRGVIVLEIDSGARPKPESSVGRSARGVLLPLVAIGAGGHAGERQATLGHLCTLRDAVDATADGRPCRRSAPCSRVQHVSVEYDPTCPRPLARGFGDDRRETYWYEGPDARVATTWSLSPAQKQRVLEIYEVQRTAMAAALDEAFRRLTGTGIDPADLAGVLATRWQVEESQRRGPGCTQAVEPETDLRFAEVEVAQCRAPAPVLMVRRDSLEADLPDQVELGVPVPLATPLSIELDGAHPILDGFAIPGRPLTRSGTMDVDGPVQVLRAQRVLAPGPGDEGQVQYLLLQVAPPEAVDIEPAVEPPG